VELFYRHRKYDFQVLKGYVSEAWKTAMNDKRNRLRPQHSTPEKILEHKKRVIKLLENFYADLEKKELVGVDAAGVEQSVKIDWVDSKGRKIRLNGYVDRIMVYKGKAWVSDWKTTKDIPTQEHVDKDIQLTFYSAFYRYLAKNRVDGKWPKKEEYLELWFPEVSESIKTTRGKEHFDDMKKRVEKAVDVEAAQLKKASPSEDNCRFCEFRATNYCPESLGGITS